jgi:coenzyme F420 hydrogenase subunit beta
LLNENRIYCMITVSAKPKVFGHLLVDVVRPGHCVACGSCVSACPVDAIKLVEETPKLVGKCTACGACYMGCPRTEHEFTELEKQVLGRTRMPEEMCNGIVIGAYAVKALGDSLKRHVQDGGAVTAILLNQVKAGDGAVVAGLDKEKPWLPVPVLTKEKDTIIRCAGTKYTSAPMIIALKQAEREGLDKVAFVGTPCQIHALRRRNNKVNTLAIGLFCMETFDYDKLMAFLREQGVDPTKVTKFEIKSGKFIARSPPDAPYEVKIRKLKELSRPCCRVCQDYTSELADISVGNVGSPDGYSTVLIRSAKGKAALEAAEKAGLVEVKPLSDYQPGMGLVDKLADMKKKDNVTKPLDQ